MSHEIELQTTSMNSMAAFIRTRLSGLSSFKKESRMALTQQRKQGQAFMEVMKKFKDLQSKYKKLYRDQLERQYRIINPEASDADIEALEDNPQVYTINFSHSFNQYRCCSHWPTSPLPKRH